MKIFGIGKNYLAPGASEATAKLREPIVFLKADSSFLNNHKPFFIPQFMGRVDYEGEIVVRICRLGKGIPERFANRYYDALTIGVDFTAHDILLRAQAEGLPWDICKGFDGASTIGEWVDKDSLPGIGKLNFQLDINNRTVQKGCTADMIFSVDQIISYISMFYTIKTGDIIFTGTPAGTGPVNINDHIEGFIEGEKLLEFNCK